MDQPGGGLVTREALIAQARAAESETPEQALGLWAEAASTGAAVAPDRTGWDRRPKAVAPLRRRGPLPEDMDQWVAAQDVRGLVALIDDLSRLTDFRVALRLKRALRDSGRQDVSAVLAGAYLDMILSWKAYDYRAALAGAERVLDLAEGAGVPPGVRFEAEAIRLRAAQVLGEPVRDFSPEVEAARPPAVARARLLSVWKQSPERGLALAARLALDDDPKAMAEVLAVRLTAAIDGDAAGLAVARGLILRRRTLGDYVAPELCLAGAALGHRLGDRQIRDAWLAAYFDYAGMTPPVWPAASLTFDAVQAPRLETRDGVAKVSVAMSAHDAAGTVELAVRSLMGQSYRNLEILIVDDASTDDTLAILHRLAAEDGRIRLFETTRNAGTYVARNRALEAASGDYFTCLDADDWAHPARVQRHVSLMEADPRLVATRSNWFRMTEDGEPALRRSLGVFTHPNPASPFYRTQAVREAVGYYDRVRFDGDMEHWLRLTTRFGLKQTARLKLPLTLGRIHGRSLTGGGVGALDAEAYSPVRSEYRASALIWRQRALEQGALFIDRHPHARPFPAPAAMLP